MDAAAATTNPGRVGELKVRWGRSAANPTTRAAADAQGLEVAVGEKASGTGADAGKKRCSTRLYRRSPRAKAYGLMKAGNASNGTFQMLELQRRLGPGRAPGPLRVLVVDDEGKVRNAAAGVLERQGMIVHATASPSNLVQEVRRFKPDVIVLDEFFEKTRVSYRRLLPTLIDAVPGVRVVITSSRHRTDAEVESDLVRWGASDILRKSTMLRDHSLEDSVLKAAVS